MFDDSDSDEADEDLVDEGMDVVEFINLEGGPDSDRSEAETEGAPIEEDDPSLPMYDTDNRHSYMYHDTGPVSFANQLMNPLEDGRELQEVLTTFHSFPLSIGDELPYLKMDQNDNRVLKIAIEQNTHIVSINCGEADSYAVASWLRDRSKDNETSLFSKIDAVVMEAISHAVPLDVDQSEKIVGVCRVVGRVRVERVEKSLTGLIYSYGVVTSPCTLPPFELSVLSRTELALPPKKREHALHHLLAYNSRLITQCATSSSIDRIFSVLSWIPDDVLEKIKKKPQWQVVTFLMRALPLDRRIRLILIKLQNTDAQIAILNSIDYSSLYGYCTVCHHELFRMSDLVYVKPWVSSAVFVNPGEYVFDTVTLRHTIAPAFGTIDNSFSWFSGYGWLFIKCHGTCRTHLGWRFESKTVRPSKFVALKRESFRVWSEEIKLILEQYDGDHIHPTRFFNQLIQSSGR